MIKGFIGYVEKVFPQWFSIVLYILLQLIYLNVITQGDYFRAGGYETRYVGKWHVSAEDIYFDGLAASSKSSKGGRNETVFAEYMKQNRLDKVSHPSL